MDFVEKQNSGILGKDIDLKIWNVGKKTKTMCVEKKQSQRREREKQQQNFF